MQNRKIQKRQIDGPISVIFDDIQELIGEGDREVEKSSVIIASKSVDIIYGLGSRDQLGFFWAIKGKDSIYYGNTAIMCEDDKTTEYGPFYAENCPLSTEEVVHEIIWGRYDFETMDKNERSASISDILPSEI